MGQYSEISMMPHTTDVHSATTEASTSFKREQMYNTTLLGTHGLINPKGTVQMDEALV